MGNQADRVPVRSGRRRRPTLVSPEVHSDLTVSFRLQAPEARRVEFQGDWMYGEAPAEMTRDADGVWSVTLGPLAPNGYLYTFVVDGLRIADPLNPLIKLRSQTSASMVEVRGAEAQLWEPCDVPHGSVDINWVPSKSLGGDPRWLWVYTPPGYAESGARRYPVLYLLHGSNDTAGGWVLAGRANFILDNLIAAGKAKPMILVMPYGDVIPYGSEPVKALSPKVLERYLLREVMPLAEGKYRVAPGQENRAIAGLSMGAGQAIHVAFCHLDTFHALGTFSLVMPDRFDARFAAVMGTPKTVNEKLGLVWIGCGSEDPLLGESEEFAALLAACGVHYEWGTTEGQHTFGAWRRQLAAFLPLLFS